jgi:hypothetical protein
MHLIAMSPTLDPPPSPASLSPRVPSVSVGPVTIDSLRLASWGDVMVAGNEHNTLFMNTPL